MLLISLIILTLINIKLSNSFIINKSPLRTFTKKELGGLELGVGTYLTGILMDKTISNKSLERLADENNNILVQGYQKASINLLLIGPSLYYFLDNYLIDNSIHEINSIDVFTLTIIHSIGYFIGHSSMHRLKYLRSIHKFHHKFTNTLIPTIGNAVSYLEFSIIYMFPFIFGAFITQPTQESFNLSIIIVSIFNLLIHCNELNNIEKTSKFSLWNSDLFVSPTKHSNHHDRKNGTDITNTYSAPTFNFDILSEKIFDFKYYFDSLIITILTYFRI